MVCIVWEEGVEAWEIEESIASICCEVHDGGREAEFLVGEMTQRV